MSTADQDDIDLLVDLIDADVSDFQQPMLPGVPSPAPTNLMTTMSTCPYSTLRLRRRIASASAVQMALRDVDVIRIGGLATLQERPRSNWAVFGVVVALDVKTAAKTSKLYVSVQLTDLDQNTFRLLAFDRACDTLRSGVEAGHVLCIGNARPLPDRHGGPSPGPGPGPGPAAGRAGPGGGGGGGGGGASMPASSPSNQITLAINDPDQVLHIGISADLALCKGRHKNGTPCRVAVDGRRVQYCSNHMQGAYRSRSATRMDLQHGSSRGSLSRELPNSVRAARAHSMAMSASSSTTTITGLARLAAVKQTGCKRGRISAPDPEREAKAKDIAINCLKSSASYRPAKISYVSGRPAYVKATAVLTPVLSKSNPGIKSTEMVDLDEDGSDPSVTRAVRRLAGKSPRVAEPEGSTLKP